jgi:DHA2 family multidrug resistance protein
MWDRGANLHHAQLAEHISPFDANALQALDHLRAGGVGEQQSYQMLNRLIDQQAFMMSANDIFFMSALLFLGLIGVIWLARPIRSAAGNAAAAAAGD